MDRYKAYLLPGVAALMVLAYYLWRWTAGDDPAEPAATPAASGPTELEPDVEPSRTAPREAQPARNDAEQ